MSASNGQELESRTPRPRARRWSVRGLWHRARRLPELGGSRALTTRTIALLKSRVAPDLLDVQLRPEDVADPWSLNLPIPERNVPRNRPLTVAFVTVPPRVGSGGHTTMFRMVAALEAAGHQCRLALHNPYLSDLSEREALIRQGWPEIRASVHTLDDGLQDVDVAIATAWQTAHALAAHGTSPMWRCYLVQDYEPYFYPRGAEYSLAEQSYLFGFTLIALGEMTRIHLRRELGLTAEVVPFGCDLTTYRQVRNEERRGVVYYAMPGVPRRGFLIAREALRRFHEQRPDQPIHAYGDGGPHLFPFPVTWHGRLRPHELNELYNRCAAGLTMSFTNISLVAEEMLAAGLIPVVNEAADARADLDHPAVRWSHPSPSALARTLIEVADVQSDASRREEIAPVGRDRSWTQAQARFVACIEGLAHGQ